MKQVLISLAIICLLLSCNSNPNENNTNDSTSTNTSKPTTGNSEENTAEEIHTELPSIAICANEIGIEGLMFGGDDIKLKFEEGKITSTADDNDVYVFVKNNRVIVEEMSGGTGGDEYCKQYYMFLQQGDSPIVLLVSSSISEPRYGSIWREETYDWSEILSEKTDWEESKIERVANSYASRAMDDDSMDEIGASFSIDAFQKKNEKWVSVINTIFPSDFNQRLAQFLPILTPSDENWGSLPSKTSLHFGINSLFNNSIFQANKSIPDNWEISTEEDGKGFFAITKKGFRIDNQGSTLLELAWDGTKLDYAEFPDKAISINYYDCCPSINFAAANFDENKVYTFKGKLIDAGEGESSRKEYPIQLEAKFKILKPIGGKLNQPLVKMTGEYFYIGKNSKMPIEGEFSPTLGKSFVFNRIKKGKKREKFQVTMTNCSMQGWWQHLERMDLYELKLVLQQ